MMITKQHGIDVYWYFRRRKPKTMVYHRINGKTWAEVAEILGLSIPNLFRFLEHSKRAGLIRDVRIV